MSKFIEFSYQELDKEHLSVLRALGRAVGVKAPAALSKGDLIENIIGIQRGNIEPCDKNNKGAPPKIDIDLSKFYDFSKEYRPYNTASQSSDIIVSDSAYEDGTLLMEGTVEESLSGYGFIRLNSFQNSKEDVYVSPQNLKKFNIRSGDKVKCTAKAEKGGNSAPALQTVISINGLDPDAFKDRKCFDDLMPYYPDQRITLEGDANSDLSLRTIDLFAPIGKGQRGLIVAPPKTGKTTILKNVALAIEKNHPEIKLIVLLIDERPEEVTDMIRSISSEVVYSTFDETAEHHVRTAESIIARAKRLVEVGTDVVILLDSITRLARAYNNVVESSGKILSGGLDPMALQGPKRFFGSARNIDGDGSLTILATALVETGSRLDEVIFEEFKGTGNMELHLSKDLSEKRIFPAFDLYKSGTRKEELLLSKDELDASYKIRKVLANRLDATEGLVSQMGKTENNLEFISKLDSWLKLYNK